MSVSDPDHAGAQQLPSTTLIILLLLITTLTGFSFLTFFFLARVLSLFTPIAIRTEHPTLLGTILSHNPRWYAPTQSILLTSQSRTDDIQLPLGLLTAAQGHPMLVELKNGETLNGHLVNCDNWMNLILKEVVQTSPEGDRFFKLPEVYIRGNNVNRLAYIRDCQSPANAPRSNTYESPRKSSIWSRNSSRINSRAVVAAVHTERVGEGIVAVVDGGVVVGEVEAEARRSTGTKSPMWAVRDTIPRVLGRWFTSLYQRSATVQLSMARRIRHYLIRN